jgi:TonB family protein
MRPYLAAVLWMMMAGTSPSLPAKAAEAKPLELEQAVAPHYPANACGAQLEGQVEVEGTVTASGALADVRANGPPILKDAARTAALAWRFRRPTQQTSVRLTFTFKVAFTREDPAALSTAIFRPPFEVEVRCGLTEENYSVGG